MAKASVSVSSYRQVVHRLKGFGDLGVINVFMLDLSEVCAEDIKVLVYVARWSVGTTSHCDLKRHRTYSGAC